MNAQVPSDSLVSGYPEPGLAEIELTPEQRKRAVDLYRNSSGSYHDLGMACAHVIFLRDRVRELETQNALYRQGIVDAIVERR